MQKIKPCIWMNQNGEEAANLYVSLVENSRILDISRYGKEGFEHHGQIEGTAMVIELELAGYRLQILNGGPMFKPNPSISLFIQLPDADVVDRMWNGLVDSGTVMMAMSAYSWSPKYGWLNDKFGVSWQISVPMGGPAVTSVAPTLMFVGSQHGKAKAALDLYTDLFPNSGIDVAVNYDGSGADPADTLMHARAHLGDQMIMAMDSAQDHAFQFSEGLSLSVSCKDQAEVDHFWDGLTANGGEESQCGWLKDRFGVFWQIVPDIMGKLMCSADKQAVGRAMQTMFTMKKLDIARLQAAYDGV